MVKYKYGDDKMKKEFKPQEFADLIGKDKSTLLRWDKSGKLIPYRFDGKDRYYSLQQLKDILGDRFNERKIMSKAELLDVIDELEGVIFDIQNEEAEKVLKEYWETHSDEL